nr:class I SAM-dependent methyltransferase [uncultured Albidiferax sp.]
MRSKNTCLVCGEASAPLFENQILGRYPVAYFQCQSCGMVHTEHPYWLDEAYGAAISSLDVGMVGRNIFLANKAAQTIAAVFDPGARFLDYAGGYGLFVRMMRDKGFDFYRQDRYCSNIFAQHLDLKDLEPHARFELVTAFEVFEHLVDPVAEVRQLFDYADSVLFSTVLVPEGEPLQKDWWYLVPETGQHIVFFTARSLELLAQQLGCRFFSNQADLHLFTRRDMADPFTEKKKPLSVRVAEKYLRWALPTDLRGKSLLAQDFEAARQRASRRAEPAERR